jgi:pimeloyl-ACP methyl ester carboxylesterase
VSATELTRYRGGAGPPLVLLHGLGLTWRSYLPVLDALEERHAVCALDLPGFGDSPPFAGPPTPAALSDAVERELDALGLERPLLVGNSLGGWIALELARRGRAERVVAISPAGLETPPERAYVIAMNELMRLRAKLAAPLGMVVTWPLPTRVALFVGLRSQPWRVPPRDGAGEVRAFARAPGFQSTLRHTEASSVVAGLSQIRVPVRIAFGTADLMLGAFTAPRFAVLIPGADLVALHGVGHVPMADDPSQVARAILGFTANARAA